MSDEKDGSEIFTFYFNVMIYLGCWTIETEDPVKKFLYSLYSLVMNLFVGFIEYMGVLDLIDSFSDINKLFYNVCFGPLVFGTWLKKIHTVGKSRKINALRRKLERTLESCKDQEERDIFKSAIRDVKFILRVFLLFLFWLYPAWIIASFCTRIWGKPRLPFPAKWPAEVDLNDFGVFLSLVLFQGTFAVYFLSETISLEVTLFGLLTQIYREFRFLIKKIHEFGLLYDDSQTDGNAEERRNGNPAEVNCFLKKGKNRLILREIITRQKELLLITKQLEECYRASMFIHIFLGGALLVVNGIQSMIVSFDINENMAYQFGYVLVILSDMLYLCWLCNRISLKCTEVGTALYTTPWYKMDVDSQKDICLVILQAQRPPRITAGNFVELNQTTFMGIIKNMYSWYALFRQVTLK